MTDLVSTYRTALDGLARRVHGLGPGDWSAPTPCAAWDVRDVVNHVVGENLWAPELLAGRTIADVGDRLDGDLLGDDPPATWDRSQLAAADAASGVDLASTVHLSFGDVPAEEYLWQLTADAAIHAWDLARASGQDERLDPGVVAAVAAWFDEREELYRSAGAIGSAVAVDGGDAQAALLGRFGRDPSATDPLAAVVRFGQAFAAHDLDAIDAAVTDDVVFVDTTPPDGNRHEGRSAVRSAFEALFAASPAATFNVESGFVAGPRVVHHWLYRWGEAETDHVRGIDVFDTRDGKVASKQSYVKG